MGIGQSEGIVRFEGFELEVRSAELRDPNGKTLRLSEQPLRILIALLERPGELILREDLRKRLWPNDTVVEFEHSINAAMNRLRQALGDSAEDPKFVELWRGADIAGRLRSNGGRPPGRRLRSPLWSMAIS